MKSIIYTISIITLFALCFCACNPENSLINEPEGLQPDISNLQIEADSLYLPVSLIQNMTTEAKQRWRSSLIISEHTYIKDNQYYIDLSENDANKLGVPSSYYHYRMRHQDSINNEINKIISDGKTIELVDLKEIVTRVKKDKHIASKNFNWRLNSTSRTKYSNCAEWPFIEGLEVYKSRDTIKVTHRNNDAIINITCNCEIYAGNMDRVIGNNIGGVIIQSPLYTDEKHFMTSGIDEGGPIYLVAKPTKIDHKYNIIAYSGCQYITFEFLGGLY